MNRWLAILAAMVTMTLLPTQSFAQTGAAPPAPTLDSATIIVMVVGLAIVAGLAYFALGLILPVAIPMVIVAVLLGLWLVFGGGARVITDNFRAPQPVTQPRQPVQPPVVQPPPTLPTVVAPAPTALPTVVVPVAPQPTPAPRPQPTQPGPVPTAGTSSTAPGVAAGSCVSKGELLREFSTLPKVSRPNELIGAINVMWDSATGENGEGWVEGPYQIRDLKSGMVVVITDLLGRQVTSLDGGTLAANDMFWLRRQGGWGAFAAYKNVVVPTGGRLLYVCENVPPAELRAALS